MNVQSHKEKGFTIIEVVLVLAIAALIFLMVFIALPALQRSQRDTARKTDVSTVAAAINTYTSGNKGTFPSSAALTNYSRDLSDNITLVAVVDSATTITVKDGEIKAMKGKTCGPTGAANSSGSATQELSPGTKAQYVVVSYLEAGGGTSFCQQN